MLRKITADRPFKVLGFTDTHLDDYPGCYRMTRKLMRETIEAEQPDLVVFVGDNVTGGDNRRRAHELAELMTELNVPWAPAIGNHEGDNPASVRRDEMIEIFMTSPTCLIPSVKAQLADGTEIFGVANYSVPLYNEAGEVCHRFIFLDGGDDMTREDMIRFGYGDRAKPFDDYIKPEQVAWYREQIAGDACPSTVFCHIPLPEHAIAWAEGERLSGVNYENFTPCPVNGGLFDAILEKGKTVAVVAGHDHVNASRCLYKGIELIYNRMSGMSSYNTVSKGLQDKLMQGCSVYTIDENGRMTYGDILYEDRYPQYRDDIFAVIRTPCKRSS